MRVESLPRPVVGHRSRFGGLWTDLHDAPALVDARRARGEIGADLAARLHAWIEKGYVVIEGAVSPEGVDAVLSDVEEAWRSTDERVRVEHAVGTEIRVDPPSAELRAGEGKLLGLHAVSGACREAIFAPELREFLQVVFDGPALAFSTLLFESGTRQPIHQDTAYVGVSSPMEMAASWIALEDIEGDCGKLEYFEGSHRIDELVFDGSSRLMPPELTGKAEYHQHLHQKCLELGCKHVEFAPRKGDALIWSADLVHGGSARKEPGSSRRSLVTHYCPAGCEPGYFEYWKHSEKLDAGSGCLYSYYLR